MFFDMYIGNPVSNSQITLRQFINGGIAVFSQPIGYQIIFFRNASVTSMHFSFLFHCLELSSIYSTLFISFMSRKIIGLFRQYLILNFYFPANAD